MGDIHDSQIEVGFGVAWIQRDAAQEVIFGFFEIPGFPENDGHVIVGNGVFGIQHKNLI